LLLFYDFPAEHWKHLRTTNPIESTFATVRHRIRQAEVGAAKTMIVRTEERSNDHGLEPARWPRAR
jgi:transposase-like protein